MCSFKAIFVILAVNISLSYIIYLSHHLLVYPKRQTVYLDSDLVLMDDIAKLAATPLGNNAGVTPVFN